MTVTDPSACIFITKPVSDPTLVFSPSLHQHEAEFLVAVRPVFGSNTQGETALQDGDIA